MPEYIDKNATVGILEAMSRSTDCECIKKRLEKATKRVSAIPAADVAPVVHCKGCEHAERYERTDGTVGYYCGHPQNTFAYGERWDRVFKPVKEADDFCSYGERRDKP